MKIENKTKRLVILTLKHSKNEGDDVLVSSVNSTKNAQILPGESVEVHSKYINDNPVIRAMIRSGELVKLSEHDAETKAKPKAEKPKTKQAKQTPAPAPESGDSEKDSFMASLPGDINELIELGDLEYDLEIKKQTGVRTEVSIKRAKEAIWKKHKESQ